jgi:hypothetical protein
MSTRHGMNEEEKGDGSSSKSWGSRSVGVHGPLRHASRRSSAPAPLSTSSDGTPPTTSIPRELGCLRERERERERGSEGRK